jgi:hypothetical protein
MRTSVRRAAIVLVAALSAFVPGANPALAAPAPSVTPPAAAATGADTGAAWLAAQLTANGGFLTGFTGDPSVGDTADAVLALFAAGTGRDAAATAVAWLQGHIADAGADPGQLAKLILVADAAGLSPTDFAGAAGSSDDLVAALLATQRTTGPDAGLFGAADPSFDGAFRQGLALTALVAAGVAPADLAAGTGWLTAQQCANGALQAYRADTSQPCGPTSPSTFSGPDSNSTALAVMALAAVGDPAVADGVTWLNDNRDDDGGWAYYPGPSSVSDPNSTGLAMLAVVAAGGTPPDAAYTRLLAFQLTSGADSGAFWFDLGDGTQKANVLATVQAVPAVAGRSFPLGPSPIPLPTPTPTPTPTVTPTTSAPDPTPTAATAPSQPADDPTVSGSQLPDTGGTGFVPVLLAIGLLGTGIALVVRARRTERRRVGRHGSS